MALVASALQLFQVSTTLMLLIVAVAVGVALVEGRSAGTEGDAGKPQDLGAADETGVKGAQSS